MRAAARRCGNAGTPSGTFLAPITNGYATTSAGSMNAAMIGLTGNSQPVSILPPYLVVNFCIAMEGIFPSRS